MNKTTTTPASPECIQSLCDNVGKCIQDIFMSTDTSILLGKALESAVGIDEKPEYLSRVILARLSHSLSIGVQFVLMDLGVSVRAVLLTGLVYEKRFNLKNCRAVIAEGYKLVYGFGKQKNKSLICQLIVQLNELKDTELKNRGDEIISILETYSAQFIQSSERRNLTYHYDENMIKVYTETAAINNEDDILKEVIPFLDILSQIKIWADEILYKYVTFCKFEKKIDLNRHFSLIEAKVHEVVKVKMNESNRLSYVVRESLMNAGHKLDTISNQIHRFNRIREFMIEQGISYDVIEKELDGVYNQANSYLLLGFMAADMSSIVDSYLSSTTSIESALNLRRMRIIISATLSHLYGYNEEEQEKSYWKRLGENLPADATVKAQYEQIGLELKGLIDCSDDKDIRNLFVHYADNHGKTVSNIPELFSTLKEMNPMVELIRSKQLMTLNSNIQRFLSLMMVALSREAAESRKKSAIEMESKLDAITSMLEKSGCPEADTNKFRESFEKIKLLLKF